VRSRENGECCNTVAKIISVQLKRKIGRTILLIGGKGREICLIKKEKQGNF